MITWYGRYGQDKWVSSQIRGPGFFVDVGAANGRKTSNTNALEQLGWTGILIDALHRHCILARQRRTSPVVHALISDDEEVYPFLRWHKQSCVLTDNTNNRRNKKPIMMKATTLTSVLDEHKVEKIDYLSIDVEGFEIRVLNGLDFDKYKPRIITVERDLRIERKNEIHAFLASKGYGLARDFKDDAAYVLDD